MSDNDKALALLRELEWSGSDEGTSCCPACGEAFSNALAYRGEPTPHAWDCELAELIGAPRKEKS